eukprot:TRINITY_DN69376_c0_g1_i1.p1 TRINITY_DN69376_c0_g1~~TRINITY_DN69376_c0_g1_i1.p1  ORF type:complete len:327 (-),score=44.81 TRINITY_DN69376_c0_g1_i1:129-1109(-)
MNDLQDHMRKRGLGPRMVRIGEQEDTRRGHNPANDDGSNIRFSDLFVACEVVLRDDIAAVLAVLLVPAAAASGVGAPATLAAGLLACWAVYRVLPTRRDAVGVRVVCISDTHGHHRKLELPKGDVLIHAGDFTRFGKREHAEDFNQWLGGLDFKAKIVVNGNHESNAEWQRDAETILSNATFLKASGVRVCGLDIYGTDFCWPMRQASPWYALIPLHTDVVVSHGPAFCHVDGAAPPPMTENSQDNGSGDATRREGLLSRWSRRGGCRALLAAVRRIQPRLVVSGHLHDAHGVCQGRGTLKGTTFVNAANCKGGYALGWEPIVVDL